MCDFAFIIGMLLTAEAAIIAAIVATGVAIAANSSFFAAPTATLPFGIALGCVAGAAVSIGLALTALDQNTACLAGGRCAAEKAAASSALAFIAAGLAASAAVGLVAMFVVPIPLLGAATMIGYSVGLGAVAVGIGPASSAIAALQRCAESTSGFVAADIAVGIGIAVGLLGAGYLLITIGQGSNKDGPKPNPFG